jgi:hypothetical protein
MTARPPSPYANGATTLSASFGDESAPGGTVTNSIIIAAAATNPAVQLNGRFTA